MKKHFLFGVPLLLAAALSACGDDGSASATDSPTGTTIADRTEWCAVVADVDERFEAVDNSGDDFRTRQAAYAEINTLLGDLSSSIAVVDDDVREDINASLAWAANIASAFVSATDETSAASALEAIFQEVPEDQTSLPGSDWILENCGVDIDG